MSAPDNRYRFELRVFPDDRSSYGIALYEDRFTKKNAATDSVEKVVQVYGDVFRAVIDQVLTAIKRSGYRPTDLKPSRQTPFMLKEEEGVRLGLLLLAVKPLKKHSRIDQITQRIREMEPEEIYYWYSKSTAIREGRRAQKALRILIAEE